MQGVWCGLIQISQCEVNAQENELFSKLVFKVHNAIQDLRRVADHCGAV